jgi:hypothetical protein
MPRTIVAGVSVGLSAAVILLGADALLDRFAGNSRLQPLLRLD